MMKVDELRESYLSFFESKGCVRRSSDVLVPRWDPSVLFTPAGMNQFKDHFLGRCKLDFTRATTCQKCLRTGDIDNVGRTAFHHTFFEMLGNFGFGDYFKRDAIHWAWEYLTSPKWLNIPKEKLSVTVYRDDEEAYDIWVKEIGVPADRIGRLDEDENFWPASAPSEGPDGVCGPCSEIYFDTGCVGTVEIWNLVFTQFNRVGPNTSTDGSPNNLRPLPSKNIDTGMGLERIASALQGVSTNFHIDTLRPLVEAAAEVCGERYDPDSDEGRRFRRIADHVRACTFAIHENVIPGPNKEKYVVKRLLRRAVLDGHQLGVRKPFLYQLVGKVAEMVRSPYPELGGTTERVAGVIRAEEENFLGTIDGGLAHIERIFAAMQRENRRMVAGADAAEMYQTHGFPPELFATLAGDRRLLFDWDGYRKAMEQHGIASGAGNVQELFKSGPVDQLKKQVPATEFVGYDSEEIADAKIVGIIADGKLCDHVAAKKGENGEEDESIVVVLDGTPFYGEMGGQVGDRGVLDGDSGRFLVEDAQVDGGLTLHCGKLTDGEIRVGMVVRAHVAGAYRQAVRRAHTAAHLLHAALRSVLGEHAQQQGSCVDRDLLRFDFAHPKAVTREELKVIEEKVNYAILSATPVESRVMPVSEARATGAMMLFGEKYPDEVRVVGADMTTGMAERIGAEPLVSKELCGGTHVRNTAEIGTLRIVSEESVAAGTRRISAVTGLAAWLAAVKDADLLTQLTGTLRTAKAEIPARVETMAKEIRQLKKQVAAAPKDGVSVDALWAAATLADAAGVGKVRVVVAEVASPDAAVLRDCIDRIRQKCDAAGEASAIFLAGKADDGKVTLIAGLSRVLVELKWSAAEWLKVAAPIVGGGGGGRPDMAQAGGKDASRLDEAMDVARRFITGKLNG